MVDKDKITKWLKDNYSELSCDGIAKGLKNLSSYKKSQSKNKFYKTTNLIKI